MAAAKKKTAAKKSTSKAVATKEETGLATSSVNSALTDLGALGTENLDAGMLMIPRLSVLQALSPACAVGGDNVIEGATPGMFFNNVTEELLSGEGFEALVVHHRFSHLEWTLREKGGGFVEDHGNNPALMGPTVTRKDDKNRSIVIERPNNHVVETHEFLLLINVDGNWEPVMFSTTPSTISAARKLNSLYKMYRVDGKPVPSFARSYKFASGPKPHKETNGVYFVWNATVGRSITELGDDQQIGELIEMCKGWHADMSQGKVAAKQDEAPDSESEEESDDI